MGRILFGGTTALLICIFLSPKFIAFLRAREFGQHIREDGPQGHLQKAGTPTMGGLLIFLSVSVPFLILTNYDWPVLGVFFAAIACAALGFADDYTKLVRRRSLGLGGRTHADRHDRDLDRALVHRAREGPPAERAVPALRRLPHRCRPALPGRDLP